MEIFNHLFPCPSLIGINPCLPTSEMGTQWSGNRGKPLQFQGLVAMGYIDYAEIYVLPKKVSKSMQVATKHLFLMTQKKIKKAQV